MAHEIGSRSLRSLDPTSCLPQTLPSRCFVWCYGIQFADLPKNRKGPTARFRGHPFDRICLLHSIDHRLTKPNHPWTNGQVERMNRTIKEATVQRYHYDSHEQLRTHLSDFVAAYNFAKRLKTLSGLTAYEFICKCWQKTPDRFILDPIHQMPGLYT